MNKEDLQYVKRFSMCNCVTSAFEKTYTAFRLTIDFFIKKAVPGELLLLPESETWPKGVARAYKIPARTDTFLFSPFNEAYCVRHVYKKDSTIYSLNPIQVAKANMESEMKRVPNPEQDEFMWSLVVMDKKITQMWGNRINRVLILYDSKHAPRNKRKRLELFDDLTCTLLKKWPVIRVSKAKAKTNCNHQSWCHYSKGKRAAAFNELIEIEGGSIWQPNVR